MNTQMPQPDTASTDDVNLYDDPVILNPWPHYARLRDKGPVVWLPSLGNYAFTTYEAVREGLRDHETYLSGMGSAGDAYGCAYMRGNTVASDPPRHTKLRDAMIAPLKPDQIKTLRPTLQAAADKVIDAALAKTECDAVVDLAQPLPLTIVRDLVGLPDFGKENMLTWASAAFDMQGIQNTRGKASKETIEHMRAFILRDATPDKLRKGSWTHRISELADAGALDSDLAPLAMRDYIVPSLDTTISAIGHLVHHLSQRPDLWQALREEPSLALAAAHEAVRIGTPIRTFSRHTSREVEAGGHVLPKGARVMMLYASGNHDEAVFPDARRFDLHRRNGRRHLGFGAGIHMCVGMHLALLEIECLITSMIDRNIRFTPGTPEVTLNNSICAFASLPVQIRAVS